MTANLEMDTLRKCLLKIKTDIFKQTLTENLSPVERH